MDYQLQTPDSAIPCEVTCDPDNGRFMIRKADTSGEVFNSAEELTDWLEKNWTEAMFTEPGTFDTMIASLKQQKQ
ncbi:hypothetical protein CR205_06935 [Alteribacter lacisalsi]|uniref:Threonine dehydratase n=1 Tax=Alteribacter lacisalsi TaxID=2045244 RepID=A0A2W0HAY0_9BACI|nr:hypothetical protein [Alteribacter lacisalsi]PYZ98327.1 hypothetical protein CR205_06935 [Alteribacter lacisalsi]